MSKPIPFHALLGQEDYARVLSGRYAQLASQWLTPVEIFRPHYANAIARYILAEWHACGQLDSDSDLTIYELGGGTGTCAANILAHIRDADPRVFARTKYVGVEVSLFFNSHTCTGNYCADVVFFCPTRTDFAPARKASKGNCEKTTRSRRQRRH
jgi:hypothetical protein